MANPMKQKGTSFETAVVRYLVDRGIPAYRKVQTGKKDTGDIGIHGDDNFTIEAKNRKAYAFGEYVEQANKEAYHAGSPFGVAVVKRNGVGDVARSFAVMDLETLTDIMLELEALREEISELEA